MKVISSPVCTCRAIRPPVLIEINTGTQSISTSPQDNIVLVIPPNTSVTITAHTAT